MGEGGIPREEGEIEGQENPDELEEEGEEGEEEEFFQDGTDILYLPADHVTQSFPPPRELTLPYVAIDAKTARRAAHAAHGRARASRAQPTRKGAQNHDRA